MEVAPLPRACLWSAIPKHSSSESSSDGSQTYREPNAGLRSNYCSLPRRGKLLRPQQKGLIYSEFSHLPLRLWSIAAQIVHIISTLSCTFQVFYHIPYTSYIILRIWYFLLLFLVFEIHGLQYCGFVLNIFGANIICMAFGLC